MWRVAAIVPSQPRKQRPQQDRRRPGTRAICADDRSRARHPAQPPQPSEGHNAIICATAAQIAERAARAMEAFVKQELSRCSRVPLSVLWQGGVNGGRLVVYL